MTVVTFVWLPARAGPVSKHKVPPIWRVPGRETLDKDIGSTTTTHITMKHFLPYKRDDGPGWDIIHRKTDYFQNIALRIFWKCPLKLNQPKI